MEENERTDEINFETDNVQNCGINPPKGVSEKDYANFLNLLDRLNMSEEEDMENEEDGETQKEKANDSKKNGKKRVQFAKGTVIHSVVGKKSILRNGNERSPINSEELQKICKRDFVEFLPTSKEILSDFVCESSVGNIRERREPPMRTKTKSAWKTRRMGLTSSDEGAI